MTASPVAPAAFERLPTGIAGLDVILRGGVLRGSSYFVMGTPGAGKTILANQLAFHHVATGGRVVYVTLLTETHGRLLAELRTLTFFDPAPVGTALYYVSGSGVVAKAGLDGLRELVHRLIRERGATLLVLDGLAGLQAAPEALLSLQGFIQDVQVYGEHTGCTTLLLGLPLPAGESALQLVHTMVDGVITLRDRKVGPRSVRELEVEKFRGSGYLRGQHAFSITDDGIVAYPRTEAVLATPSAVPSDQRGRRSLGVARLDAMLQGGVRAGSTTVLLGATGSGKTLLGAHFLAAGARAGHAGLHFGFYEPPPRVIAQADQIGLDFSTFVRDGLLELIWQPPLEHLLDALAARLLAAVQRRQVRCLFIDGLAAFGESATQPQRLSRYLTALANELHAREVTTVVTLEVPDLIGPLVTLPVRGVSTSADNLLFLRTVELRSQLYRLISIMKVREGGYDAAIREFTITDQGIVVAETFASAEALLTGVGRSLPPGPASAGPPPPRGGGAGT